MALSGVRISWLILARKSDLCELARSAARLAAISSSSARFHWVMSRNTRAQLLAIADIAERHEQRDQAALADTAEHFAPIIDEIGDATLHQAFEILEGGALALRREQQAEGAPDQFAPVIAEQRLAGRIDRQDAPRCDRAARRPSVAVSRMARSSRAETSASCSAVSQHPHADFGRVIGAAQHQHDGAFALPGRGEQTRFHRHGAAARRVADRQRFRPVAGIVETVIGEQSGKSAGPLDVVDRGVAPTMPAERDWQTAPGRRDAPARRAADDRAVRSRHWQRHDAPASPRARRAAAVAGGCCCGGDGGVPSASPMSRNSCCSCSVSELTGSISGAAAYDVSIVVPEVRFGLATCDAASSGRPVPADAEAAIAEEGAVAIEQPAGRRDRPARGRRNRSATAPRHRTTCRDAQTHR